MNPNTLAIAAASEQDDLLVAEGAPVWPIRDADDRTALEELARVFGSRLVETEAAPGVVGVREDVVLAVGAEFAEAARLYAHLTRRRFRVAADPSTIDWRGVRVVLCRWKALTFSFLEQLEAHAVGTGTVGLLVADGGAEMRRQVLVRSAAAKLRGPAARGTTLMLPDLDTGAMHDAGLALLGSEAGREEVAAALGGNATVLGMINHGDGLDVELGAGEVLCAVRGNRAPRTGPDVPDCVAGAYCYRLRRPLEEALASPDLFAPEAVRARVVVALSCFVVPASRSLVRPRWSLLRAWLASPTIGAAIVTWGLASPTDETLFHVTSALAEGRSAGETLRASYRGRLDASGGHMRTCLFGDPDVRVPEDPHTVQVLQDFVAASEQDREDREAARDLGTIRPAKTPAGEARSVRAEVLRRVLVEALRRIGDDAERAPRGREALELLGSLQAAPPDAIPGELVRSTSIAALRFLAQCEPVWNYFPQGVFSPMDVHTPCSACGERVRYFRRSLHVDTEPARIAGHCDRCGLVFDTEEDSRYPRSFVQIEQGRLRVPPALVGPDVYAVVIARTWWRQNCLFELLPTASTAPTMAGAVFGRTTLYFLALKDLEIIFLRRYLELAPWGES